MQRISPRVGERVENSHGIGDPVKISHGIGDPVEISHGIGNRVEENFARRPRPLPTLFKSILDVLMLSQN